MSTHGMDLTFFNAGSEEGSITIFRKTKEFLVRKDEGFFIIRGINENEEKRIPEKIFNNNFIRYPGKKDSNSFCIKPPECRAIEMECSFYVLDCETLEKTVGQRGDFIVTRESGINEIVKGTEFFKKFFTHYSTEITDNKDNILSI